ncbi:MAG: CopG family transcriptional regulator [Clostridia bacterium]|nr:CopG family transcriptional regulator [Clostridia bacterium]
MAEKKFVVRQRKYGGESQIFSIRIPKDMVAILDRIAEETGRTRNEIVLKSLDFAIENLVIEKK